MFEVLNDKRKIAVVLFNLGGPDSLENVKPFLFNLFNDKYIISLPWFLRFFVAKLIAGKREKIAQEIYSHTGNKSPILEQTLAQAAALEKELTPSDRVEFKVFTCMRHWHPMTGEVVRNIEEYGPTEVIMLPLYPQFSTTTTGSSFEEFIKKLKNKDKIKIKSICCYPKDENFINAHVSLIEEKLADKKDLTSFRVLFSAHGLPEKIVKSGDPYQWQVEKTVQKIIEKLSLNSKFKDLDYKITYQSKVGPLKWLEPNTEDEIKLAGSQNKSLVIVPVAFVSEHVETLVELDIEYKKIADSFGIEYIRIPALCTHDLFIKSLISMLVKMVQQSSEMVAPSDLFRICPEKYSKCICK
jgi:ferrochelatase